VITARGLRKDYPSGPAVQDLDLDVSEGAVVGLLGPNGAGKTTTLRMLTTLLRPTGGTATIAGADLLENPAGVRRRIGSVAQGGSTDPSCTVVEELVLQGRLHSLNRREAGDRANELAEEFELDAARPTGQLSGGQRRRLDLALGLVHRPAVLFLDEPTVGLDPRARAQLWSLLAREREAGTTIVLSTHYLEEADACCDRVVVIDTGRVIADDTPARLKQELGSSLDDVFRTLTGRRPEKDDDPFSTSRHA
jgi:ABC-2 type transport system ATP-binding protein